MKITFTSEALKKPEGMNPKAELAWDYLEMNRGCWQAAECSGGEILVTDESGSIGTGEIFPDISMFVEWLTEVAESHIEDDLRAFLLDCGAVNPALLTDDVLAAILRRLGVPGAENTTGGENA